MLENHSELTAVDVSEMQAVGRVLCFEALRAYVDLLKSINANVFGAESPVEVIYAAVSDQNGEVEFPNGSRGAETMGIGRFLGSQVRMTTVDEMLRVHNISKVDVLVIDTEGHDPAVIGGAEHTL
jgi:FkbM family methyltransferase